MNNTLVKCLKGLIPLFIAAICMASPLHAQQYPAGGSPSGAQGGFNPAKMNIGHFYGKVVDEHGKGVGYATVQLFGAKFDPVSKSMKDTLYSGQITAENGDFSLEKLPVFGDFTLKIAFIGYAEITKTVSFGLKMPQPGAGKPAAPPGGQGANMNFDKDLGNIALSETTSALKEVTVTAKAPGTTLALDRKVYRVDKDLSATGGNAQDALKNVPSLSVDLDGNVSLRNGAPQIFVDGRPTTLSLDQIAADAIESVEVITNPSAKYDAGGGTSGIVNIVLKKEKRLGYNGNARLGADSRGGFNLGGDINARGEKINLFASGNLNQNKNITEGQTLRQNLTGDPLSNLTQTTNGKMSGLFANARAGVDWFMDNRNTLTFSGNYTRGKFNPSDEITTRTDYLFPDSTVSSQYVRNSQQDRNFRNLGASVQFKHLFPKQGTEWTADVNYNRVHFMGSSDYNTLYDNGLQNKERQEGDGKGQFFTFQSDFVDAISDKVKVEGGVRAALRRNNNDNANYTFNEGVGDWVQSNNLTDHYKFSDDVYAAYGTFSQSFDKWNYQVGLRAESSFYNGALTDRDSSFTIAYPISLFPSLFVNRKLNETDNLQFSYTRRVNRPNFFQTMPFIDFTDSLNLRRGNVHLKPEFTNAFELTYQSLFAKGQNLLVSLYFKQATNLITTYLGTEYNADLNKDIIVTSYANANSSIAYGAEITLKNALTRWLDLTSNINVYQSEVDASNVESGLTISRLSGFVKENLQVKLPAGFSVQLNGEWRSRASFTPSNNNDPFRGGPGGGPAANTAQGYSISNWFMDASVRKDILHNKGSLTLSVNDIFATRRNGTFTGSDLFVQDTYRLFAPQTVRLNFAYRFGKMDTSLFKRKNMKQTMQGNDMM